MEAKETSSSSVKKLLSAKYFPTQNKIINRNKPNFTVGFSNEGYSSSPKITHSVHVLSVSQTKASLIQSALSSEREGDGKRRQGSSLRAACRVMQHVGI